MKIAVYICPAPGCGNYYGTSGMGPEMNDVMGQKDINFTPLPPERHFKRSECPDCRTRGERVDRVLCEFDGIDPAQLLARDLGLVGAPPVE